MSEHDITVSRILADELATLIELLDEEFVYKKQRMLSFARRFSGVYCLDNIVNLYVVREAGSIISSASVKRCQWIEQDRVLNCAAVGAVFTAPHARGRGLASAILHHVENSLRQAGLDFAVLWTTIVPFYEKLGWHLCDQGLFGILQGKLPKTIKSTIDYAQLVPEDALRLEVIRTQRMPYRVIRQKIDYQTVPFPAQVVERFAIEVNSEWIAYAIVGRLNDTGYVYEVVGDSVAFEALWSAISKTYKTVYINDCIDSPSVCWLDAHELVNWTPQNLTMYKILSNRVTMDSIQEIYISFLDRI